MEHIIEHIMEHLMDASYGDPSYGRGDPSSYGDFETPV